MTEYILPASSDRAENQRLDLQHVLLVKIFGGLIRSPINKDAALKVLDIGCGTGSWSVDFAHEYPNASILGFDASSYDTWQHTPSQCSFINGDMGDEKFWEGLPTDFDLIHARFILVACRDWPGLIKRCAAHLKPGGWIEMQESYGGMVVVGPKECSASKWISNLSTGFDKAGYDMQGIHTVPKSMEQLGLGSIKSDEFRMVFGEWSDDPKEKELGKLGLENLRTGIHGFANTIFTKVLGMTDEEEIALSNATLEELGSGKAGTYLPLAVVYGQKA